MKIVKSPKKIHAIIKALKQKRCSIGFVPTMGALHEGHISLVRKARQENDIVVVSIFVNPAQFGPREDLKKYPRPIRQDKLLLKNAKADYLFLPSAKSIYPVFPNAIVDMPESPLTRALCGKFRPGHFSGVMTVVAKLFIIINPDRVYFGAKDYQQSVIIDQLIKDFSFDIKFIRMPTVREKDGLAMSSRNRYLTSRDRARALVISQTLFEMRHTLQSTKLSWNQVRRKGILKLKKSLDKLDYLEIVDPVTLQPLVQPQQSAVIVVAGYVGKTRLIDNVIISRL